MSKSQIGSHDHKLLAVLDTLGSYFVDVYFNHVWASAQVKSGKSITDEYVRRVNAWVIGIKSDEECYRQIVRNLHNYFQSTNQFTTLTFSDFVEKIASNFIPEEYYDLLGAKEKDETLGSIVADLASNLGAYATSPEMLPRIIDHHEDGPDVTVKMMQDYAITTLLSKRGDIHNRFLRKIGQTKESVSMDVVVRMKRIIKNLAKEKSELQSDLAEVEERAMELEDKIRAMRRREAKFAKLIRLLQERNESGAVSAALAHRVPRHDMAGEEDPLDFHQPVIPRPNNLGEANCGDEINRGGKANRVDEASHVNEDFFEDPEEYDTRALQAQEHIGRTGIRKKIPHRASAQAERPKAREVPRRETPEPRSRGNINDMIAAAVADVSSGSEDDYGESGSDAESGTSDDGASSGASSDTS